MLAPTLTVDSSALSNLMGFLYQHESTLTEYGALKIQMAPDCLLALKKRKPTADQRATQKTQRLYDGVPIYAVQSYPLNNSLGEQRETSKLNEDEFWSSISATDSACFQSETSDLPNKTLFSDRLHRRYFSLHHIPRLSLLQLINGNTSKFVPKLTMSHGPGAIFPLASTQHGLSSLVYHHGGGSHHWYIIPAFERSRLQQLLNQNKTTQSQCLQHGAFLIDPSILEKHQIRYYRIIQAPHELVVLSSGAFSQRFANGVSWIESCVFALPYWIRDGHAYAHLSLCQCQKRLTNSLDSINLNIFNEFHIQQYIRRNLYSFTNGNIDLSVSSVDSSSRFSINPVFDHHLIVGSTNSVDKLTRAKLKASSREKKHHFQSGGVNQRSDGLSNEPAPTLDVFLAELETILMSEQQITSSVEISNPSSDSDSEVSTTNHETVIRKRGHEQSETDLSVVLFVSGLSNNIEKEDLYEHFVGSTDVVFKYSDGDSTLKSAFITHRTREDTERNFHQPIDRLRFGSQCSISYAKDETIMEQEVTSRWEPIDHSNELIWDVDRRKMFKRYDTTSFHRDDETTDIIEHTQGYLRFG